jgi:hypothetical protein
MVALGEIKIPASVSLTGHRPMSVQEFVRIDAATFPAQAPMVGSVCRRIPRGTALWWRRSAEFLGQSDEKAFRPADVTEPIHVFILDNFAHELRAALAEPLERLVDVVHREHDA